MAIEREKDIIELQISVDDSIFMEIFQRKADLCCIESEGAGGQRVKEWLKRE